MFKKKMLCRLYISGMLIGIAEKMIAMKKKTSIVSDLVIENTSNHRPSVEAH